LANLVQMMILLFVLRARFENLDDKRILKSVAKIAIASIFAGIAIQLIKHLVAELIDIDTFLGIIIQSGAASVAGLVIFILVCYIIRVEEFLRFKESLTRRIFKSKKDIIEDISSTSRL
ncbi:MAG: hypothetical protein PHP62_05955, partial [Candidatus Moranbacteria bacterium]|nr:hypothetical protein [Candidatus Moranbacteria bacterium]